MRGLFKEFGRRLEQKKANKISKFSARVLFVMQIKVTSERWQGGMCPVHFQSPLTPSVDMTECR